MKLLLHSDFCRHSGFAKIAESVAAELTALGWEIVVLAVNYRGDPHPLQQQYRIYPAGAYGDLLGRNRLAKIVEVEGPDAILMITDPWVVSGHLDTLGALEPFPPVAAYMPVDAPHLSRRVAPGLSRLGCAIAYTDFGARELSAIGAASPIVIPHGIDHTEFFPMDQGEARRIAGIPDDQFVTLLIDRNQPRKALDIAVDGFCDWLDQRRAAGQPIDHLQLVYHGALQDLGWDLGEIADDRGYHDHLVVTSRDLKPLAGVRVRDLRAIYSMADVRLSTTAGEGWGLTIMEAMACGVPVIAPAWSALAEWTDGAIYALPVRHTRRHRETNTIAGYVDQADVATALATLYDDADRRVALADDGLCLVQRPEFRWEAIGRQFDTVLRGMVLHWREERRVAILRSRLAPAGTPADVMGVIA